MPHSYPMAHGFTAPAATAAWRQVWIDEKKESELKAVTILKAATSSAIQLHKVRPWFGVALVWECATSSTPQHMFQVAVIS